MESHLGMLVYLCNGCCQKAIAKKVAVGSGKHCNKFAAIQESTSQKTKE